MPILPVNSGFKVERGYFGLGGNDKLVEVTSSEDFMLYIWARNVDTTAGGVQILTPPSQFRGAGSTGPFDGLVMNVPAQSGVDLGAIGGKANEKFSLTSAGGDQVTVYLTVVTGTSAQVSMTHSST
jgi:hypothetical protein